MTITNDTLNAFSSLSSSYYGIVLSFNVAVFGGAAFLFYEHLEEVKSKKEWLVVILIFILSLFSIYCGLQLFKILQEIILSCSNNLASCELKLTPQRCWLNSQIVSLILDICLMSYYAYTFKVIRKRRVVHV